MIRASGVLLIAFFLTGCASEPTDDAMMQKFQSHRPAFETLRRMLEADSTLRFIGEDSMDPNGAVSDERAREYRRLLDEIGAYAARGYENGKDVSITTYGIGLSISGRAKGYRYVASPPPRGVVVDDLDAYYKEEQKRSNFPTYVAHRPITEKWYLYHSVDG